MTLAELKASMIKFSKMYYSAKAHRSKGSQGSIEIIAKGGAEWDAFKAEITGARADFLALKTGINALSDTSIIDDFATDSDANMITYVDSKMPGLAGDPQKLDVAVILQMVIRTIPVLVP